MKLTRRHFQGLLGGLLGGACAAPLTAWADEDAGPIALVGGHLIPVDQEEIPDGVLVMDRGKIVKLGRRGQIVLPAGTRQIDARGKTLMPGLVCTHSHIGGVGAADGSGPIQPGVRVMDSINVRAAGFKRALAGGLTTLNIMPGSGHLISGQTIYVKLRWGGQMPSTIEDIAYRDAEGAIMGGLKMANGTNSIGDSPFPGTRGKSAYLVRQKYIEAREYRDKVQRAGGDPEKLPKRDLDLEALVEVLEGKRIVHHHTHRADDIMTVLRLKEEFGFRVVLHHVSEAWKIPQEIAASGAPCSVILVDSPGGKLEARYLEFKTGRVLEEAGVRVAFHTDDLITDSRVFFRMAALAIRAGMSRQKAIESLTIAGAEMIDLDDRVGTLTPGKDADVVVLSGDPFSVYTKVLETWVEGQRAFDRSEPRDELFAEGGFGAGSDTKPYLCCASKGVSQQ